MRSNAELRQHIARYIGAFNARDFATVEGYYARDATLEDPVGSGIKRGRAEIRAFYEQYRDQPSFLQLTGDFRFPDGAVAFTFYCYMGDPAEPMIVEVTDTFRFDEAGLITEMRAFWGPENVYGVASRSPAPGIQAPFAGQVVLVTGEGPRASATASAFAQAGAVVIVAAPADQAEAIARSVREDGGRALPAPANLADRSVLPDLAETALALGGRLDACVNLQPTGDPDLLAACAERQLAVLSRVGVSGRIVNVIAARPEDTAAITGQQLAVNWLVASDSIAAERVGNAASWLCLAPAGRLSGAIIDLAP